MIVSIVSFVGFMLFILCRKIYFTFFDKGAYKNIKLFKKRNKYVLYFINYIKQERLDDSGSVILSKIKEVFDVNIYFYTKHNFYVNDKKFIKDLKKELKKQDLDIQMFDEAKIYYDYDKKTGEFKDCHSTQKNSYCDDISYYLWRSN